MNSQISKISKAQDFAIAAHKGQFRKDGITPFVSHPIAVVKIAKDIASAGSWDMLEHLYEAVIITSYLHDTVEDTDVSIEDIKREFGEGIADCVQTLTREKDTDYSEYLKSIINGNIAIKIVKLADMTHNLSTAGNKINKWKIELWKFASIILREDLGV